MKSVIEIRDLKRSFGNREVLCGVSARAEAGKVIGLLGRNGEGKTTLFKILMDILGADSGFVEVLGKRPDGSAEIRQRVGFVPERPAFHEFMTVEEVFALRSDFFANWDQERARTLANRLDLDRSTPVRGASKGTLAKIAWVCAAAHDPELFLLDEPTSGLDAVVREKLLSEVIGELHDSGKTILIANHRMEEAAGMLDEVWILAGGKIARTYPMDKIRAEACKITGRLKDGPSRPADLAVIDLEAEEPITQWASLDKETTEAIKSARIFENAEFESLDVETSLRLMLQRDGGGHD